MVPIETKGGKKRERERRERGGDFCWGLMFCVFFAKR
jgi:hypothetical protein